MDVRSDVTAVQVYRRGARVTRTVTLTAPQSGPLAIPGLPLSLEDATASVEVVAGDVEVRALQITLHLRPRNEAPEAPDQAILRDVERRIHHQESNLAQLRAELDLLQSIQMPGRPEPVEGQAPPPSPMAGRVALDTFVHEESEARHHSLGKEERALQQLRDVADDLRHRIAEGKAGLGRRPDELSKVATAQLSVASPSEKVVLHLHYHVPGAHWVPQYQVDVGHDGDEAALTFRAAVVQATGEDWRGVKLTLSTALPQQAVHGRQVVVRRGHEQVVLQVVVHLVRRHRQPRQRPRHRGAHIL